MSTATTHETPTATEYPLEVRPLTADEGSGFLVTYPDLPGCMADAETMAEAVAQGEDAVNSWVATAAEFGDPIPEPGSTKSGQLPLRMPKTLHSRLAARAKSEGVSVNMLIVTYLAEKTGSAISTPG